MHGVDTLAILCEELGAKKYENGITSEGVARLEGYIEGLGLAIRLLTTEIKEGIER